MVLEIIARQVPASCPWSRHVIRKLLRLQIPACCPSPQVTSSAKAPVPLYWPPLTVQSRKAQLLPECTVSRPDSKSVMPVSGRSVRSSRLRACSPPVSQPPHAVRFSTLAAHSLRTLCSRVLALGRAHASQHSMSLYCRLGCPNYSGSPLCALRALHVWPLRLFSAFSTLSRRHVKRGRTRLASGFQLCDGRPCATCVTASCRRRPYMPYFLCLLLSTRPAPTLCSLSPSPSLSLSLSLCAALPSGARVAT